MRIYWESLKKWGLKIGIPVGISGFALLFYYLIFIEAIIVSGYSGDMVCSGTPEDPCFAYINFTVKEDIFLYPVGYDPWGRDTPFSTDKGLKSWKMYRSWGKGWREIKLDKTCTGTWCGAPNNLGVKYSFVFREGRDYQIKIEALKNNPNEDIKWGFGPVDPTWYGKDWVSEALLTNVTAETGVSNFTHLNISTTAPYDDLLFYLSFDGDAEDTKLTTHYDFGSLKLDGTGVDDAVVNSSTCLPNFGDCLQLDGTGDYVSLGDTNVFDVDFTETNISISTWIYTREEDDYLPIFISNDNDGVYLGYWLATWEATNSVWLSVGDGTGTGSADRRGILSDTAISPDQWYHVVGIIRNVTDMDIYINGNLDGETETGTATTIDYSVVRYPVIGRTRHSTLDDEWNGMIDEFMIFNKSLSATEVSDIYNNQSARFVGTGKQELNNQSYLDLTGDYVNVTTTFDNNFRSNVSLFLQYYSGGSWTSTSAQNITSGVNASFDIGSDFTNLTLNYSLIAGNVSNPFYTPIIFGDINIWNHTIGVGEADIDYSVAVPLDLIRFGNCSPDFENADSRPIGQDVIVGAINATNTGGATGDFTINLTGALNPGWTIWASNDSLVHNITLTTTAQTIWSDVTAGTTKKIWLAGNCSFISANPGQSISMWVA
ncbi:MAG: LamG domain-containing protein [Promethearchaeota archaeon]